MQRTPVIVICGHEADPPADLELLRAEAELIIVDDEEGLRAAQNRAAIALVWDFRSDLLRTVGPGTLAWIHTNSIGLDAVITPDVLDRPVTVTNTRGVFEPPMAEWVLASLLFMTKAFRRTVDAQRESRWDHRSVGQIRGRRALILGPGGVGREIALLLRAVGITVDVVGRHAREDEVLGQIFGNDDLDRLLGVVDDVVVALPLTEQTRGIIDAGRLSAMRRGTRLVNVGRGALIVEDALVDALQSEHLDAAALDVFETEPLPADHPFWRMDNVLVSAHMSGDADGWQRQSLELFRDNLRRWVSDQPLRNVVDKAAFGVGLSR